MARIVSRIIGLNELLQPEAPPSPDAPVAPVPPPPPAPLVVALRRVPLAVWLALVALGTLLCPLLFIFVLVAVAAWKLLSRYVVIETAPGSFFPTMRRQYDWDHIRPNLQFDEAGRIGTEGEVAVLRHLERLPDEWVILHDLRIPADHGTTQLDLVLISPFGVWCLEIKAWTGRVYGQETERSWTQVKRYAGETIKDARENPVQQNAYHCRALSSFLSTLGCTATVHPIVVFTRAELQTNSTSLVIPLSQLLPIISGQCTAAIVDAEEVTDLALRLQEMIPEPTRASLTTVSAAARHQAQVTRVPVNAASPAPPAIHPPFVPSPPPALGTASGLTRVLTKAALLGLLLVLTVGGAAVACSVLNAAFSSLTHSSAPCLPLSNVLPLAFLLWLTIVLKVLVPQRKRRRRR